MPSTGSAGVAAIVLTQRMLGALVDAGTFTPDQARNILLQCAEGCRAINDAPHSAAAAIFEQMAKGYPVGSSNTRN